MGPLNGQIAAGPSADGDWQVSVGDQGVQMMNQTDPGSINIFQTSTGTPAGAPRQLQLGVALRGTGSGSGYAGLFFGFDPNAQQQGFYAYIVGEAGNIGLYQSNGSDFTELWRGSMPVDAMSGVQLGITEAPQGITLTVNGTPVGQVPLTVAGRGNAGIIAGGIAEALFANFSVAAQSMPAPAGPRPDGGLNAQGGTTGQTGQIAGPAQIGGTGASAVQGPLRLVPTQIMDPNGFGRPMMAAQTMLPAGWKTEGGVIWPQSACLQGPQFNWSAEGPDGFSVAILQNFGWVQTNFGMQNPCINANIPDAESLLRFIVQNVPEWQATDARVERPAEVTQIVSQVNQNIQQMMQMVPASQFMQQQRRADGAVLRASISDEGVPKALTLLALTVHSQIEFADTSGMGQNGQMQHGETTFVLAVASPPGTKPDDHPGIGAILGNFRTSPEWDRAVMEWRNKMMQANQQSNDAFNEAQRYAGRLQTEAFNNRMASQDRIAAQFNDVMTDTTRYDYGDGQVVGLDSQYNHAWKMDDGSIVQTDDPNFDPATLGLYGTEMQRAQY